MTRRDLRHRLLSRTREEWAGLKRNAALLGWQRVAGRPGIAVRRGRTTPAATTVPDPPPTNHAA